MHIPDGFIDIKTSAAFSAAAAIAVGGAVKGARNQLSEQSAPLAGLTAVFIFAVQMLNFPVAAGTSGHLLGAAGAIEAAFSALSVRDNIVPPTKGLNNSEFQLNFVKENALKDCKIDYAISNSFGFGGTNSSLIFKKYD